MELTALPGNTTEKSLMGSLQTGIGIADNQLNTLHTALYKALQESLSMDFLLTQCH
jgi:hypothetical protein